MRHANGAVPGSRHTSASGPGTYYYSSTPAQLHTSTRSLNQPPSAHSIQSPQPIHHTSSAASSPAQPTTTHTYRTVTTTKLDPPHRAGTLPNSRRGASSSVPPPEMDPPSYYVEHLASFAVGRQFGLQNATDGIRKLKQMERNSAIFAQPLVLKLFPDRISVEEENGELVEQFTMDLVVEPTAHQSNDPQEIFNNILLFIVKEDQRNGRRSLIPTEMHIFQCFHISANEVADDIHQYTRRNFHKVRPGRRSSTQPQPSSIPPPAPNANYTNGGGINVGVGGARRGDYRDDASVQNGNDYFEYDVNTLNRCFDDIERFVARIQSAAIAQRELEIQNHRLRSQKSKNKAHDAAVHAQQGILQLRAQIPTYNEFFDIFQKFKLCFNLLSRLKNHIHDPNAPELLHFLFTPLSIIVDACHWGLGRNVAEQVISPLLTADACELLRNCLSSKEIDLWMMLGKAWRTPPEEWPGPLPPPYRPNFYSNFSNGPYNAPFPPAQPFSSPYDNLPPSAGRFQGGPGAIHRGASAPPPQQHYPPPSARSGPVPQRERSFDNLDFDKINLDKERLEFEKRKVREREARLHEDERRLRQEQARLEAERRLLHREAEKQSMAGSDRPDFYRRDDFSSAHPSPRAERRMGSAQALNGHTTAPPPQQHSGGSGGSGFPAATSPRPQAAPTNGTQAVSPVTQPPIPLAEQSPRQRAFVDELMQKRAKTVQVTYDRVAQNPKELTVARGEFLEVLNDNRNWWECKNAQTRVGYVPHTILSVVSPDDHSPRSNQDVYAQDRSSVPPPPGQGHSPRAENHYATLPSEPATVKSEPSLADGLQSVKLRPVHQLHLDPDYVEFDEAGGTKPSKKLSKLIMDEQKYVPEMVTTIKQNRQLIGTRRITSIRGPPITVDSSIAQVQQWLTHKGFSDYVKSVLSKCNGEHLFRITRQQLQQYCGDEGNRLYSLITVQKKRANYSSGSEEQLKALLSMRRQHIDEHNDGVSEPDDQLSLVEQQLSSPPPGQDQNEGKHKTVVPFDPEILKTQPIVITAAKRPLQQTNNLPVSQVKKASPLVAAAKEIPSNYIAPKHGSIPEKVQIQILPRARLPPAPLPASIQPVTIIEPKSKSGSFIEPKSKSGSFIDTKHHQPIQQVVKPTIVEVRPDDDEDDSLMSDSPRTQSLRMIAQTVKRYY